MTTSALFRRIRREFPEHIADRIIARMLNGLEYESALYAERTYGKEG